MDMMFKSVPGTVLLNQQIPKTGGGLWSHKIDFFIPNYFERAFVTLHGGGGTKGYHAVMQRVRATTNQFPTANEVNWKLLNTFKTIAVYPQGSACRTDNAVGNPFNPNGVNTVSANYPNGIPTWSNNFQWSGEDDFNFLKDLHAFIKTTYGSHLKVNLHGTSNGGIMTLQMHKTDPVFDTYGSTVGPLVAAQMGTYAPPTFKPLALMFGRKDDVLGVYNGIDGPGDHWFEDQWYQQPAGLTRCNVAGSYVTVGGVSTWVPQLSFFQAPHTWIQPIIDGLNTQHSLPAETYTYAAGVEEDVNPPGIGTERVWRYCDDKLLMKVFSEVGHNAKSFLLTLKTNTLNQFLAWMVANGG